MIKTRVRKSPMTPKSKLTVLHDEKARQMHTSEAARTCQLLDLELGFTLIHS